MRSPIVFLSSKVIRERYGISSMTLWRWERSSTMGFPKPMNVNGRKRYKLSEIEAWERTRAAATQNTG
jgi:predicted DNA-binding transcriptional regulator AlpA